MRTSRSRMITALLAVAGFAFLLGCGSQRKPEGPPPKTAQDTSKNSTTPRNVSPAPNPDLETWSKLIAAEKEKLAAGQREKSAAEAKPKMAAEVKPKSVPEAKPKMAADTDSNPPAEPKPKSSNLIRPKLLTKGMAPPKTSAKPTLPSNAIDAPPVETPGAKNPVRNPTPPPPPQSNPVRSDSPPRDERVSDSLALPPNQSNSGTSKYLLMRKPIPGRNPQLPHLPSLLQRKKILRAPRPQPMIRKAGTRW